jgi:hypothetical protein
MSSQRRYRAFLSDMHLKPILMTVSTNLEPGQDKILLGKHQYHRFICRPRLARILHTLKSIITVLLNDTLSV